MTLVEICYQQFQGSVCLVAWRIEPEKTLWNLKDLKILDQMRVITALVVRAVASYGRYEFFISLCKRPAASEAIAPPASLMCSK